MLYNKINYLLHTLLWSKYRLLINMLFILTIYIFLYSTNYSCCMNNTNNIVDVPVNQSEHSQAEDLRREISAYAESHASLLEEIQRKNQKIDELTYDKYYLRESNLELRKQNGGLGRKIHELREANIELREANAELINDVNDNYDAYKEQCRLNGQLGRRIAELKQELRTTRIQRDLSSVSARNLGDALANIER